MALLNSIKFPGKIWEPACGDGAISKVMIGYGGYDVVSVDLIDRGYGESGVNFLLTTTPPEGCLSVVTNPPYKSMANGKVYRVEDWIRHTMVYLKMDASAFLLKSTSIAGKRRVPILKESGLKTVYQLVGRISGMMKSAAKSDSSMMDFAWFYFERGYRGLPNIEWIEEVETSPDQTVIPLED